MTNAERARFEVLLEDISSKVGFIAEGHAVLADGQTTLRQQMLALVDGQIAMSSQITVLAEGQKQLRGEVTALAEGQKHMAVRLDRIEHHLGLDGKRKPLPARRTKKS